MKLKSQKVIPWIFFSIIPLLVLTSNSYCQENKGLIEVQTGKQKLHFKDHYASYKFSTSKKQLLRGNYFLSTGSNLIITSKDTSDKLIHVELHSNAQHYFGFGEQFSHLDFSHRKPYIFTEEQGIGRGDKPITGMANIFGVAGNEFSSYVPMNFFFTEMNKGYLINGGSMVKYDFTKPNSFSIESWSNQLSIITIDAKSPKEILTKATQTIGRMPMLPEWAFGTWLGLQGGSERVEKILNEALLKHNPVTAVWIQDWVGRRKTRFGSQLWWTWETDTISYPNFKNFCKRLESKGVKVLGYINPFVANQGKLCDEGLAKNYFVKNRNGTVYQTKTAGLPAYLVDLTNPGAFEWMKGIIKHNLIEQGLSGWMADYGEWLPLDAKLFSGEDAFNYHNQYAVDWARLNREAIQEAGKEGEIVFFSRSGSLASAKYSTLFWTGDQMVNWGENDGFPSAVCAMITSGLSGITLNHSDIGGYTTLDNSFIKVKRDEELLKRWIEFAAFTPVFRTHEGLKPESNYQVYSNDSSVAFFSKFGTIHWALRDYFKELNKEASEKGIPLVRALLLEFPNDTNAYSLKDEFLLGEDLLVAPVIKKGVKMRSVYFPEGEWIDVWTKKSFIGPVSENVHSEIGFPPVFIKKNGQASDRLRRIFNIN